VIQDCAQCGEPLLDSPDVCPACGHSLATLLALAPVDTARQVSAPVAWVLGLALPGAGQFFCGATRRGLATLAFFVLGLVLQALVRLDGWLGATPVRLAFVLWLFSAIDAFFTARDVNLGLRPDQDGNPRVAAMLNAVVPGFGYFYLAERVKGFACFALFRALAMFVAPSRTGVVLLVFLELGSFVLAADAYRLAARARQAFVAQRESRLAVASQFPAALPLGCAGVLVFAYLALLALAATLTFSQLTRAL